MNATRILPVVLALLAPTASARAENWPCFRGPTRQGVSTETGLPLQWSATEKVQASMAVSGKQLFIRTAGNLYGIGGK